MFGLSFGHDCPLPRTIYGGVVAGAFHLIAIVGVAFAQDVMPPPESPLPTCDPRDLEGCIDLAFVYHEGRGVEQDDQVFVRLLAEACGMGAPRGCTNLGSAYDRGDGVPRDRERARRLFELACSGDNTRACNNRGNHYEKLEGKPTEAALYFERACSLLDAEGCYNLGRMREVGATGQKDETGALAMYETACIGKHGPGCTAAGRILDGSGMLTAAHEVYTKACNLYDIDGCLALAAQYESGRGVSQDYAEAMEIYRPMCDANEAISCAAMGRLLENGLLGRAADPVAAARLYTQACDLRHPGYSFEGCRRLARLLSSGLGVPKDEPAAQKVYTWLCEQGQKDECELIKAPSPAR